MSKGKLYIIVRTYFMADFILEALRGREDIEVIPHCPRKGIKVSALKWLRFKVGNPSRLWSGAIFPREFNKAVGRITPDDRVLLWGVENYKYVMMMAADMKCRGIISFLWNPMHKLTRSAEKARRYMQGMRKKNVEVCSFDPSDCQALGCHKVNQVHRAIAMGGNEEHKDPCVFFVGQEKGREKGLEAIITALEDNGIRTDINIVRGKHHRPLSPLMERNIIDTPMKYDEVLLHIGRSSCLIDMVQPGQTGVTLRSLEAMFYGKKLITNNISIKEVPFYQVSNIYIVNDPEEQRSLPDFVRKGSFTPLDEDILSRFRIEKWLDSTLSILEGGAAEEFAQ